MTYLKGKKIGILGGIGPESTAKFYSDFIKIIQEKKLVSKNSDFPQIIVNNIPAPELFGSKNLDKDIDVYLKGLKEIDEWNPDIIVMVCNTAHIFYDYFQKNIHSRILNLVPEVEKKLRKCKSYAVVGSSTTIDRGLYNFKELNSIEIEEQDKKNIDSIIYNYNKGSNRDAQKEAAVKLADKYLRKGAECILLACTEISLILTDENIPKIDSMEVLIESLLSYLKEGHIKNGTGE